MQHQNDAPLNLLIVDDEVSITNFISYLLTKMPYHVRTANSGAEALSIMREMSVDILITDINMPGMSGLDLMKQVSRNHPDVLAIAITGYGDIDVAVEFMKQGGIDFLQKPMSKAAMLCSLESAAERCRLRKELRHANEELRQKNIALEREVIERKRSEKALKESERKYRDIFENAPIGIYHVSLEGRLIKVNPALARILGYESPREMISSISHVEKQLYIHPIRRKEVIEKVLTHGGWVTVENEFLRKDRTIVVTQLTLRIVRNDGGALLYMEGFVEDITEKKKQQEAFQLEMARAKEIYDRIAEPRVPMMAGVELHVRCLPAESIGGDVLEILKIDEKKLLVFLADVTGHGVPAAITANTLKMLFNEISETETDPGRICHHLNKSMYKIVLTDDIIAAFCGQIDLDAMTLTYCLCGVPPPFVLRHDEIICLRPNGLPLGVFDDAVYDKRVLAILEHDVLIAFTDGITEAKNGNGDIFGSKQVGTCIKKKGHDVHTVVEDIIRNVCLFQKKKTFQDDVIILAVGIFDENKAFSGSPRNRFCSHDKCLFKVKTKYVNIDEMTHFFIDHVREKYHFAKKCPQNSECLKRAFFQVLTNAVEHGNLEMTDLKKDPDVYDSDRYWEIFEDRKHSDTYGERLIRIECLYDGKGLVFSIEDEGNGFDTKLFSNPNNSEAIAGRGVSIAKTDMDRLVYNAKGNKVMMTKFLKPSDI